MAARLDEIGYWSEVKLDIVREYATAYSTVLNAPAQKNLRGHIYVDGFAGPGVHLSKQTGRHVAGSPLNALLVQPPFREFHLIDMDGGKAKALHELTADRKDVFVYEGDCNEILLEKVFPRARFEDYRRALCLLDPYGLHLNWEVIRTAGQMRSIEIFLNFPVMDMNMNVLWRNPDKVQKSQAERMDAFWGDRYGKVTDPFGHIWGIATHKEDVSEEECGKRAVAWFASAAGQHPSDK